MLAPPCPPICKNLFCLSSLAWARTTSENLSISCCCCHLGFVKVARSVCAWVPQWSEITSVILLRGLVLEEGAFNGILFSTIQRSLVSENFQQSLLCFHLSHHVSLRVVRRNQGVLSFLLSSLERDAFHGAVDQMWPKGARSKPLMVLTAFLCDILLQTLTDCKRLTKEWRSWTVSCVCVWTILDERSSNGRRWESCPFCRPFWVMVQQLHLPLAPVPGAITSLLGPKPLVNPWSYCHANYM